MVKLSTGSPILVNSFETMNQSVMKNTLLQKMLLCLRSRPFWQRLHRDKIPRWEMLLT